MQILARWTPICSSFNRIRVVEYHVLEPDIIYLNCTDGSRVTPDFHQHKQDQNQSCARALGVHLEWEEKEGAPHQTNPPAQGNS